MGVDLTSTRNTSSGCATRNAGGVWMSSMGLSCTSRRATKQPHLKINAPPPPPRPPPLLLLLFLHPNATCSQRVLLAERRRRRSVAMFVQAHAFVLAEGDGPRPLCMVPRAQPLSQVLKMPRSLVLQPGLPAVPLVSRTSQGVLGQLTHFVPVLEFSETPARWARPSVPLGNNDPVWPAR